MNQDNQVTAAFDLLLIEIEQVIKKLKDEGTIAYQNDNFERGISLGEQAREINKFLKKVNDLQKEWNDLFPKTVKMKKAVKPKAKLPAKSPPQHRTTKDRLPRGLATTTSKYYVPILSILIEMGGRGQTADILTQVYETMKTKLNKYDLGTLSRGETRWHKYASWALTNMKDEGYLSKTDGNPWEITEAGRQYFLQNK